MKENNLTRFKEIITRAENQYLEIDNLRKNLSSQNKQDYLFKMMGFVSILYSLTIVLNQEFIEKYNLSQILDKIAIDKVKLEASQYNDQHIFDDFLNISYPYIHFMYQIIYQKENMTREESELYYITKDYHQELILKLKSNLENRIDKDELERLLKAIHLFTVKDDQDVVMLGSYISYRDTYDIDEQRKRLTLTNKETDRELPYSKYKSLMNKKVYDVVMVNYSFSQYFQILEIENSKEEHYA